MIEKPTEPTMSDEELYNLLKSHPQFECLPLPKSWYEKFNLKLKQPMNYRECIEGNYAIKAMFSPDDLPPETIPTPADYVFPELKADVVPLEVVSKEVK
jgi:hypothetical protein